MSQHRLLYLAEEMQSVYSAGEGLGNRGLERLLKNAQLDFFEGTVEEQKSRQSDYELGMMAEEKVFGHHCAGSMDGNLRQDGFESHPEYFLPDD